MPRKTKASIADATFPRFDNGYFAYYQRIECGHAFRVETQYGCGPQELARRESRPCAHCEREAMASAAEQRAVTVR